MDRFKGDISVGGEEDKNVRTNFVCFPSIRDPCVDTGMKTFTDLASEAETTAHSSGLTFDPSYFKAKKEVTFTV